MEVLEFHIRVKLVLLCMPCSIFVLIHLMHLVLSVDTWLIQAKSIEMQFSGSSYICEVLLVLVCSLENLEMDLLIMLILIMLVIWIRGGLSRVMISPLVVLLLVGKQVCRLLLLCPLLKLNIWLFLKLVKKLFG